MRAKILVQARAFLMVVVLGNALMAPAQIVLAKPLSASFTDCASQTQIPAAECDALVAFYHSAGGPGWYNGDGELTGWLQTDRPCTWFGVFCENGANVTMLQLFFRDLYGHISPELGNLTHLKKLVLNRNMLFGSIPPELGNLANLEELNLSSNYLTGSIPPELGNLKQLTRLNLSASFLSGRIPPQLGGMTNLTYLELGSARLGGSIPAELANLTNLYWLGLSGNNLSGSIPPQLGDLRNLSFLELSYNRLSGPIPPQLGNLTNLSSLQLSYNQLSGSLPAQIGNLTNLYALLLDHNQLIGEIPVSFVKLKRLGDLMLSCGLTSSNPVVIRFIDALLPGWRERVCLPFVTLMSVASQDGWVLESSEGSNEGGAINNNYATFNLGDDKTRKQFRGILSFNTWTKLPGNAIITRVTLKMQKSAVVGGGNPVAKFQGFVFDIKKGFFGVTEALETDDFQASASITDAPFALAPVGDWYTIDLTSAKSSINNTGFGLTQIRLRFKLDDNNNSVSDVLSLYSGSAPVASRPQLIIQYYVLPESAPAGF